MVKEEGIALPYHFVSLADFFGEITHRLRESFGSHYLISNNCEEILPGFDAN